MVLAESAACLGGTVPIVPYLRSGTVEFGEAVAEILGDGMAVIWGNHGAMSVGLNLAQAFGVAHALEDTARVYLLAKQAGNPVVLPTDEVRELHHDWRQHYRQKAREETPDDAL
jgi:ribulose-5-phosphate 4-epimerase/fuculose-1-phosphate aldolase